MQQRHRAVELLSDRGAAGIVEVDLAELLGARGRPAAVVVVLCDGERGRRAQHQDEGDADDERMTHGDLLKRRVLFHAFG